METDVRDTSFPSTTSYISSEMEQYLISLRGKMEALRRIPYMSSDEKRSLLPMIRQHIAKDPAYKEEIERMAGRIRERGVQSHDYSVPPSRMIVEQIKVDHDLPDEIVIKTETPDTPSYTNSTVPSEDEHFMQASQSIPESETTTPLIVQTDEATSMELQTSGLLMVNETKPPEEIFREVSPRKSPVKSPSKNRAERPSIPETTEIKMETDDFDDLFRLPTPEEKIIQPKPEPEPEPEPEPMPVDNEPEPEPENEPECKSEPVQRPEATERESTATELPEESEKVPEVVEVIPKPEPPIEESTPEPPKMLSPPPVPQTTMPSPEVKTPPEPEKKNKRGRPRKSVREEDAKAAKEVGTVKSPAPPAAPASEFTSPSSDQDGRKRRRSERQRTASTASSTISQSPMTTRGLAKQQKVEIEIKSEPMEVDVKLEHPIDSKVEEIVEDAQPNDIQTTADIVPKQEEPCIEMEPIKKERRRERRRAVEGVGCQTVISVMSAPLPKGSKVQVEMQKSRSVGKCPHKSVQTEKIRLLVTDAVHLKKHDAEEECTLHTVYEEEGDGRSVSTRKTKVHSEPSTEGESDITVPFYESVAIKVEEPVEEEPGPSGNGVTNPTLLQKNMCISILNAVASQRCAAAFLNPVTERVAPGYKEVILCPMDINTLKRMVDNGRITKVSDLKKAIATMYANALMYNYLGHDVNTNAKAESTDAFNHIEETLKLTSDEPSQGRRRPTTRANNEARVAAPSSSTRSTPVSTATASLPSHSATPESSAVPTKTRRSLRRNQ
ncbi:hypothetical protein QR680_000999 [Steinernema hermaphroditum]|uniref:Bromo domain-containing protein n=1 Tax=Steinernema hermaphroditum TaxID=289476 RepID=A0AA39GXG6_9BILA|nr:hypothetical protein QR680_000999 [Steinernema hermaphroditum]